MRMKKMMKTMKTVKSNQHKGMATLLVKTSLGLFFTFKGEEKNFSIFKEWALSNFRREYYILIL